MENKMIEYRKFIELQNYAISFNNCFTMLLRYDCKISSDWSIIQII